jgi:hypothetical protein
MGRMRCHDAIHTAESISLAFTRTQQDHSVHSSCCVCSPCKFCWWAWRHRHDPPEMAAHHAHITSKGRGLTLTVEVYA